MGGVIPNDPWAFGWTQLLTIIGFGITITIAVSGFQSFSRWRREQLEGVRINTAIEALTLAYKTKFVFEHIRSPMASGGEWADMPQLEGDTDERRSRRGSYYTVFKRIEFNKDYFEALWKLQPRFMAIFGPETEDTFKKAHQARRNIEVAAQMLFEQALERYGDNERDESTRKLYAELRGHIWAGMAKFTEKGDEVSKLLDEFKAEIEKICLPLLAEFRRDTPRKS